MKNLIEKMFRIVGVSVAVGLAIYILIGTNVTASIGKELTLRQFVQEEAQRQGVPFEFVDALIQIESEWNPNNTGVNIKKNGSKSADHGLMQLNDATLRRFKLTKQQAYNPKVNVVYGIKRANEALLFAARKAKTRREMFYLAAAEYNAGAKNYRAGFPHAEKVIAVMERKLFENL